jgi:hypothetical protein
MSVIVDGSNGLVFNDASTQTTAATGFGYKNRIMNGAMVIAQRGTTPTSTNLWYPADRFRLAVSNSSKVNLSQSTTAPTGFVNSILATSLAATTVGSTDAYEVSQQIEGYNIADLAWGTASAATVTLSFWVRSSLTGTFGGVLENNGNTRAYPFSYTINSANTWEQKTITVAGDTSGTWLTNNSRGIIIRWSLGCGSTYLNTANAWVAGDYYSVTGETKLVATSGATWHLTGVQLERGSTATAFDYRDYGRELQMCQRYYYQQTYDESNEPICTSAYWSTSTVVEMVTNYPVPMRAAPTYGGTTSAVYALEAQVAWRQFSSLSANEIGPNRAKLSGNAATNSNWNKGQGAVVGLRSAGNIFFNAEL